MVDDDATREPLRVHWRIAGRVQGVGFRWFTLQAARRHRVGGDVCNLGDGRVEVRAWGSPECMTAFEREIRQGPRGSRVDAIERLRPDAALHFDGFEIR
ncbi:MAG: acylphosphatase [Planctomycetota bacterium]|jgi:acylphosphatase